MTLPEADRRHKRIEVDARLARLESGLKKVSVDFARRRQRSEIDLVTLCNALRNGPAGGDVLLDFVRFDRPTVPAQGSVTWTARYGAFVVRPSASACSVEHADLGPADGVDALVGAWRESVSGVESCWVNASGAGPEKSAIQCKREMERMDMMGAELRGRTLDPVRHLLPTDSERRIWLVQDGRLAEVPFGALPWSETKEGYTTYLAERWSFGYVSAPADLAITPPRSANEQAGALVVGDVNYEVAVAGAPTLGVWRRGKKVADASDGERLAASAKAPPARTMGSRALCGYTTEWGPLDTGADAMAASLSMKLSGDVQTLSGDGAVEARVVDLMGRRHSVLHIGTHGFSSMPDACDAVLTPPGDRVARLGGSSPPVPDAFALGGLALSGANRSVRAPERPPAAADGILSARELLGVDLRGTGLAVLSACETGRGSPTAGEGVLGLAKALLMAGTRTAVVSLWQVDVSATNALFERYYALGLSGGRVVPDQAGVLTRVQRQMADRYRRGEFPIRHSSWLWGAFLTLQAEGR